MRPCADRYRAIRVQPNPDGYPTYPAKSPQAFPAYDVIVWLWTTVGVSLLPFAITAGFYVAFASDTGLGELPSPARLIGHGEALLLILGICGTTFAELLTNPESSNPRRRMFGMLFSVFFALIAGSFATAIAYGTLTKGAAFSINRGFIAILTMVLLTFQILLQMGLMGLRASDEVTVGP